MADTQVPTILCLASYEKGASFLRAAAEQGWSVVLLTVPSLEHAPSWPRASLAGLFVMSDLGDTAAVINGVSYLARSWPIRRIVALDDYDVETAAALREHLRLPGPGASAARHVRDKLAMRMKAHAAGVLVPQFTATFGDADVAAFLDSVPPPWLLKPRSEVSTIGISRVETAEACWAQLNALGDGRSFHLVERFVSGTVYHVDALVYEGRVVFAEAHAYARPPLEVYHGGGIAITRTVVHGSEDEAALLSLNDRVLAALAAADGAFHAEFIKGAEDGRFYFLEVGARVGGANIADLVEAATGIDLWAEWARMETRAPDAVYALPPRRSGYGAVIISLARQEAPDTAAYADPEIVARVQRPYHAGLVLASPGHERLSDLLEEYSRRFAEDFHATMPPWMSRPPAPDSEPQGG